MKLISRQIDWLIDWLIDRCCNDVTEHRPSQRVATWGCVLDCDENWATACDGLQTFPLTGLIARSLVRLIASDWDVMMILWLLRNSECFGFFYIYIPVYDPSIISCSNFSFFNYLVYLKKKKARKINNFQEKYLLQTNCSSGCEFSLIINVAYWIIGGLIYEKRLRETKLKNLSIGTEKKKDEIFLIERGRRKRVRGRVSVPRLEIIHA